jgi:DNA-binding NtrC family response regulator
MMFPRFALAARHQDLADSLLSQLKDSTGRPPLFCPFEAVPARLTPGGGGVLILASASAADAEQIVPLVQEISLRQCPITTLIVESPSADRVRGLDILTPYIAGRFRWPQELPRLAAFVKRHAQPPAADVDEGEESPSAIIGRRLFNTTPSLVPLARTISLAASYDITALLTGETGTGKTFLARLIHECSPRRGGPFVVVPCGALANNLIESELFGHVKGAFTGADQAREGKFAAAGKGTLLLDEVDTLGWEQQARLLRVVETGEYEPIGSHETLRCAARLLVASNWDLEEAVRLDKFREDLWYRLNVLSIHLLPLRERLPDIRVLARALAARFTRKFRKGLFEITPGAMAALEDFPWPGNIRQLENVVQQAVLMSQGPQLLAEHMPEPVRQHSPRPLPPPEALPDWPQPEPFLVEPGRAANGSLEQTLAADECNRIRCALAENDYSRSRTALSLGVSRVTLYKKMKKYGLQSRSRLREQA